MSHILSATLHSKQGSQMKIRRDGGLLAALQLLAILCCPALADASSVLWVVTGVGDCTAPCGPSVSRSLRFGCYAAGSPSVVALPQTSPRMFAAKTADGMLPDTRCSGVPLPKTRSVECPTLPSECPAANGQAPSLPTEAPAAAAASGTSARSGGYKWRWNLDGEIRCSARCNHAGVLSVQLDCVDSEGQPAKNHFCEQLSGGVAARPDLAVPCYMFDGCTPEWKASPWSACSRNCGLGEIERKVECYQLVDSATGPYYQEQRGRCSLLEDKPHQREYCLVSKTCPPFYRTEPEKCKLQRSGSKAVQPLCNETGLIRNNPQCVQLTADLRARSNVTERVQSSLCRELGLTRPPPFSACQVDEETLRQHHIKCVRPEVAREPQFSLVSNALVQMERRESLQVNCGQSATVIPGTMVRLHCKVANFKAVDLKWKRPGSEDFVPPAPASGCKRVCLVEGDLVIMKFRPKDIGLYEVVAGTKNATLSLHSHSAYEAYIHAYLPRMMLLQPNSKVRKQTKHVQLDTPTRDTLLWMPGPWLACSIPCGGSGQRRRSVHCEQLQSTAYVIVNDSVCLAQLGDRPVDTEACGSHTCPVWQVGDWDDTCSNRHCYSSGYSLLTRRVQCVNKANQPLLDSQCAHEKKPETVHRCRNQLCQPKWQTSPWSPCSVSCGAYGFSSRQISCVWQPTDRPAGFACETAAMEPPKSFKACYNGPCEILGCVDLSPVCSIYQASALCAHQSLRRNCCKTCNEYQLHVYNSLATRVVSKTTV